MHEDQNLINKYGYDIYYDAVHEYERNNPGEYFDELNDSEKEKECQSAYLHSL